MPDAYPVPRNPYAGKNKNFPWIFKIHQDFHFQSCHVGKRFDSQWLKLDADGMVTIKANATGYAWDGCTPKWSILGLVIIGTPDGHIDIRTERPLTYYASLVHDAFYQYLEHVPVSKADIDRQFYEMLRAAGFPLAGIYYFFVRLFGGRGVIQRNV